MCPLRGLRWKFIRAVIPVDLCSKTDAHQSTRCMLSLSAAQPQGEPWRTGQPGLYPQDRYVWTRDVWRALWALYWVWPKWPLVPAAQNAVCTGIFDASWENTHSDSAGLGRPESVFLRAQVTPSPHAEDQGSNPHSNQLSYRWCSWGSKGTTKRKAVRKEWTGLRPG